MLIGSLFEVPNPDQTKPKALACSISLNLKAGDLKTEFIHSEGGSL